MRPTKDEYLMQLARVAATRTTCVRRGVGCVLADERGHVLAIGYNGVASGLPHCNESCVKSCDACRGAGEVESLDSLFHGHPKRAGCPECGGTGLSDERALANTCLGADLPPGQDQCEAVHAEQNAVLQCSDPRRIATAYVTLSPCKACIKLLLNTPCTDLVVGELHDDRWPLQLWEQAGRSWRRAGAGGELP